MAPRQRFKRDRPCPVCGRHAAASRTLLVEDWLSSCCFRPRGPAIQRRADRIQAAAGEMGEGSRGRSPFEPPWARTWSLGPPLESPSKSGSRSMLENNGLPVGRRAGCHA